MPRMGSAPRKNLPPDVGGSRGHGFFRRRRSASRPTGYRQERGGKHIANRMTRTLTTSWHRFVCLEPSTSAGKLNSVLHHRTDPRKPTGDVSARENVSAQGESHSRRSREVGGIERFKAIRGGVSNRDIKIVPFIVSANAQEEIR
ncbi:hypothetical protein ES705_25278 [subsurface metagenome]